MTDLAAVLRELGRAIQDRVVQAIKTGQIRRVPRPDRIWAATDIIPGGGCIWTSSEEAREEWDGGVLQGLVDAFRSEADSGFQKAAKTTAQLAGLDEPAASDHILRFLTLAGLRKATGGYAKELESLVARFVAEVSGGPLSWRVVAWLSGVTVESPITLVDGQVLRPPKSDDLAFCANAESPLAGIAPGLLIPPYAVIEVKRRSRERPSSHDARRTVNALCLFGLGSVQILKEQTTSNSLLNSGGEVYPLVDPQPHFRYHIARQDHGRLRRFVAVVAPLLPVKPTGTHSEIRWLGLNEFFRAVHHAAVPEERVALGVAAMESVLVEKGEKRKSKYLAERVAALLSLAGLNADEVQQQVRQAYHLRNLQVHGSLPEVSRRRDAEAIQARILGHARFVLMKFLETARWQADRDSFSKELDHSLRDTKSHNQLRKELAGGLWRLASRLP